MNKKFIITYTLFASFVFAFALFFFSFNIYNEYKIGLSKCGNTYYSIGIKIFDSAKISQKAIYEESEKLFKEIPDLASIQIETENGILTSLPDKSSNQISSKFIKKFQTELTTPLGIINLTVNIFLLQPNIISYYAKFSTLMILIITLITIILIIYLYNTEKKINPKSIKNKQDINEKQSQDLNIIDFNEKNESTTNLINSNELDKFQENNSIIEEKQNETNSSSVSLPYEELKPLIINNSPLGLFNPSSGIGWESYLIPRLESEINRAIASEFDLSLFLFHFENIEKNSELFNNLCNYLSLQFQFKDLIFEYKNNSLIAIRNSMTLDEALNFSDKLYSDIKNIIENRKCFIGISSRSIRMVSGERLLLEAEEALKHAIEDETAPVVAFKVDAQKYKEYMEKNKN